MAFKIETTDRYIKNNVFIEMSDRCWRLQPGHRQSQLQGLLPVGPFCSLPALNEVVDYHLI